MILITLQLYHKTHLRVAVATANLIDYVSALVVHVVLQSTDNSICRTGQPLRMSVWLVLPRPYFCSCSRFPRLSTSKTFHLLRRPPILHLRPSSRRYSVRIVRSAHQQSTTRTHSSDSITQLPRMCVSSFPFLATSNHLQICKPPGILA